MDRIMKLGMAMLGASLVWGAMAADPATGSNAATPGKLSKMTDLFPDTVVAKGKGVEVKRSQIDDVVSALARGQVIPAEQRTTLEQKVLDQLLQKQLLLAKADDADRTKGKETASKRLDAIKARFPTEADLNRQLKAAGTTMEALTKDMTDECTAVAVLERELKVKITPGEDEIKKFYDDNPSKFEQPEMVRASHILFKTQDDAGKDLSDDKKKAKHKEAEDVQKRAKAGEDFAKLAKQYSEDPGSKDKGGEYTFPRGQMVPEFEAAAFSMKPDEVSDIITTQFGYHIIKLSEKLPAKKVELAKVSTDISRYLEQQSVQKIQTQLSEFTQKMKKEANVEILDEDLKPKAASSSLTTPAAEPAKNADK